jgi:hypothetical protein
MAIHVDPPGDDDDGSGEHHYPGAAHRDPPLIRAHHIISAISDATSPTMRTPRILFRRLDAQNTPESSCRRGNFKVCREIPSSAEKAIDPRRSEGFVNARRAESRSVQRTARAAIPRARTCREDHLGNKNPPPPVEPQQHQGPHWKAFSQKFIAPPSVTTILGTRQAVPRHARGIPSFRHNRVRHVRFCPTRNRYTFRY